MDSPRLAMRPDLPRPRRVVTAPVSAPPSSQQPRPSSSRSSSPAAAASGSEDFVETLYNHPSIRIISFTSSRRGFMASPSAPSDNDIPPGSLPPSSQLERTIAVGAFQIYRAPGSVAFLSCGSALQPILPKSQCWCIAEDNSRFVLQIRRPQYWRIEVPVADTHDAHLAALLRDVFDKILLFEKTVCPFERSFTVQLPDPPQTPVKKKAWTAEGKNLISSPFQSDLSPPAHAPKPISRGRRAASLPRANPPARDEPPEEDTTHNEVSPSLRANNQPLREIVSGPKKHEDVDAPRSISPIRSPISLHDDNDRLTEALKPTVENSPKQSEYVAKDLVATSRPSSPPMNTKARECADITTQNSSFEDIGVFHRETCSFSIDVLSLDSPYEQLAVQSDNASQYHGIHGVEGDEEKSDTHISRPEHEPQSATRGAQEFRSYTGVSDSTVETPPTIINIERSPQCTASEAKDGDFIEISHSEDDLVSYEGSGKVAPVNLARKRMSRMLAGRSFTAPPQLTVVTSSPSTNEQAAVIKELPSRPPQSIAGVQSPSASTDSFHSVSSWHSSTTPPLATPPPGSPRSEESSSGARSVESPESRSAISSSDHMATPKNTINIIPNSSAVSDRCDSAEPTPRPTESIMDGRPEAPIDSGSRPMVSRLSTFEGKHRARRQSHAGNLSISRRALSPLPPAANLFSPPPRQTSQSRLAAVRRLPAAIVHKTVEILLSPPGHLVNLMLQVAAKIAAGEWRGLVFGFGEAGEQIPVQWDYYSDGDFSDLSDSDDYTLTTQSSNYSDGVPRTDLRRRAGQAHDDHDASEVD
ncbi:inheritance of peroxisomes protein 1-domain-containing protein [Xylaria palmicola]|nr:inheritance of peroxisomes protein 1-domain-containing protein [Xylaria palmicola]